jgi:hypothetical protein
MRRFLARLWCEIRWWRWFMFDGYWPMDTLYGGEYTLDRASREIIIKRVEREWYAREPRFEGRLLHREKP